MAQVTDKNKQAASGGSAAKNKTAKATSVGKPKRVEKYFDYKDFKTLQRYTNNYGQIEPARRGNLSAREQRRLARAIKRARHIALLPFVSQ